MFVFINYISFVVGIIGGLIIIFGVLHAFLLVMGYWFGGKKKKHKDEYLSLDVIRLDLGRYIILGLEFFIAKDIIETLIVPSWGEIGMLTVVVILRTVLSYFLTRELYQIESSKIEHRKIDAGVK